MKRNYISNNLEEARKKDFTENKPKQGNVLVSTSRTNANKFTQAREIIGVFRFSVFKLVRFW